MGCTGIQKCFGIVRGDAATYLKAAGVCIQSGNGCIRIARSQGNDVGPSAGGRERWLPLSRISPHLIRATLAAVEGAAHFAHDRQHPIGIALSTSLLRIVASFQ